MQRLAAELKGVRTRGLNYDSPLVFASVILYMAENSMYSKDVHARIYQRMDFCDHSRFAALVEDTANYGRGGGRRGTIQGGYVAA